MGRLSVLLSLLFAASVLLVGCGNGDENSSGESNGSVQGSSIEPGEDNLEPPVSIEIPDGAVTGIVPEPGVEDLRFTSDGIYKNGNGQIVCPVFEVVIESADLAEGSTTYDGVTYYFSIKEAKEIFEEDPSQYID